MDNINKGYLYEVQIKNHITLNLNKKAYLWNETPEDLLIEHKIIDSKAFGLRCYTSRETLCLTF